jgi:hypothetical protein
MGRLKQALDALKNIIQFGDEHVVRLFYGVSYLLNHDGHGTLTKLGYQI